jgi:hypothetical protein
LSQFLGNRDQGRESEKNLFLCDEVFPPLVSAKQHVNIWTKTSPVVILDAEKGQNSDDATLPHFDTFSFNNKNDMLSFLSFRFNNS